MLAILFLCSHWLHGLFIYSKIVAWIFLSTLSYDIITLYKTAQGVKARRELPIKFSNSDRNAVPIQLSNQYDFKIFVELIDEIPEQFQKRDFLKKVSIKAHNSWKYEYFLRPVARGVYRFGSLHVYTMTVVGLAKRRYSFDKSATVKVYPSFLQMQKYDFLAIDQKKSLLGVKKIRRLGNTMEFEQIKEYIPGDDIRTLNWKATAKRGQLMVNQYQDEKSQSIYAIIDVGRVMQMPFEQLSLLDYAINSTLAFSNIAIQKNDKVGMLTFSNTITNKLPAIRKKSHLHTIADTLYRIQTNFWDTSFELLYGHIKRHIPHRSLLFVFSNFEHISALHRQLPYIKAIAKKHVLVVIFFENTELNSFINKKTTSISDIYDQTIAQQFVYDKRLMQNKLHKNGIQSILTSPQDLTIQTINKYLYIKSRGMI